MQVDSTFAPILTGHFIITLSIFSKYFLYLFFFDLIRNLVAQAQYFRPVATCTKCFSGLADFVVQATFFFLAWSSSGTPFLGPPCPGHPARDPPPLPPAIRPRGLHKMSREPKGVLCTIFRNQNTQTTNTSPRKLLNISKSGRKVSGKEKSVKVGPPPLGPPSRSWT